MEQNKSSAEEIDLIYYFNMLKHNALKYIRVLQRNSRLFLSIFFIIALLGVAMRFIVPKKYFTDALIISNNVPADFVMVNYLQSLASDKNAGALAKELGIPPKSAKSVTHISAMRMDSVFRFSEKDPKGSIIKINLVIRDIDLIQKVQDGIMHYLKTNEYSSKKRLAKQRMLESLKNELIRRSRSLDSLKVTESNSLVTRSTENGVIVEKAVNPLNINQLQLDYYKQRLEIEEELDMLKNIEIVQPFLKNEMYSYPSYRLIFAYFLLGALILALVLTPLMGKK
ncbi:MAG: hypothetical protein WKF97_04980 [Chitinophagaceae bacterium]